MPTVAQLQIRRVLPLLAFLHHHIADILHDQLLLVYANDTADAANAVATALGRLARPHICTNHESPVEKIASKHTLVISFVAESKYLIDPTVGGVHSKYMFVVDGADGHVGAFHADVEYRNSVYAILLEDRLEFKVWARKEGAQEGDLVGFVGEREFVGSVFWLRFLGLMTRVPPYVDQVEVIYLTVCPAMMCPQLYRGRVVETGAVVGLDRLMAERMGVRRLTYNYEKLGLPVPDPTTQVRTVPPRQTVDRITGGHHVSHYWSITEVNSKSWLTASSQQFRVLAPRKLVQPPTGLTVGQALYVLALAVLTSLLALLRCMFRETQWLPVLDPGRLLFDTFARLLTIEPGPWHGGTGERVLLTVISVLAFLAQSLFSGVLYDSYVGRTDAEKYNTFEDLCNDGVTIFVLTLTDKDRPPLPERNCWAYRVPYTDFRAESAYILGEHTARTLLEKGHHHMWPEPYGHFPVPLDYSHWYLEHPIRLAEGRILDHGLWQELLATGRRSAALWKAARTRPVDRALPGQSRFEFVLLVGGWTVAAVCFVGEVMAGGHSVYEQT